MAGYDAVVHAHKSYEYEYFFRIPYRYGMSTVRVKRVLKKKGGGMRGAYEYRYVIDVSTYRHHAPHIEVV